MVGVEVAFTDELVVFSIKLRRGGRRRFRWFADGSKRSNFDLNFAPLCSLWRTGFLLTFYGFLPLFWMLTLCGEHVVPFVEF